MLSTISCGLKPPKQIRINSCAIKISIFIKLLHFSIFSMKTIAIRWEWDVLLCSARITLLLCYFFTIQSFLIHFPHFWPLYCLSLHFVQVRQETVKSEGGEKVSYLKERREKKKITNVDVKTIKWQNRGKKFSLRRMKNPFFAKSCHCHHRTIMFSFLPCLLLLFGQVLWNKFAFSWI